MLASYMKRMHGSTEYGIIFRHGPLSSAQGEHGREYRRMPLVEVAATMASPADDLFGRVLFISMINVSEKYHRTL